MTPEMLEKIAVDLQGDHPNPYTYTKSLAENLISRRSVGRTVIVRPSIVTSTWKEPIPGQEKMSTYSTRIADEAILI